MRSNGRRRCSVVAILALAYPWVLGAALLVHLAGHDHGQPGHDRAGVIELIVHGHHHDQGTPDHQHPLTVSKPLFEIVKRSVLPAVPAGSRLTETATTMAPPWYRCAPDAYGPSPPSQVQAPSVLRI